MTRYEVVNMFTDQPGMGSPLAVIPRGDRVPAAAMPTLVERLDVPEVSLVLPPTSPESNYRVRVFTPAGESPSGSHASVGTATTLVRLGILQPGLIVQECGEVRQLLMAGATQGTHFGVGPACATTLDPGPLVDVLGLALPDVAGTAPRSAGFGASTFPMVPLHRDALARARPDYDRMPELGLAVLLIFHWDASARTAYARLFTPGFGVAEDPACSPVALALGVFLAAAGWLPITDGIHGYTIHQGAEVGRPATLTGNISVWRGQPVSGAVNGQVVAVSGGELTVEV